MSKRILSLVVCLGFVVPCIASAQTLSVGDDAPPITVSKWVKGEAVERLEPGQTYVVEFWATWCGPCRTSIPHLTEIQTKFKDRGVTVLGVSVWEQDQGKVQPFVEEMGAKMDYRVALDDVPAGQERGKGKMAASWMEAAGQNGIPAAFIVRDKKIYWIGHPMRLEEPLAKVVAGDYDLAAAVKEHREAAAREQKAAAVQTKIAQAIRSGRTQEALAAIDAAIEDSPELEAVFGPAKFKLLVDAGKDDEVAALGTRLMDTVFKGNAQALNYLAWTVVDPAARREAGEAALQLARKAAERANELTGGENGGILDTLARVYFVQGDPAKALEVQEKAVKHFDGEDQGLKDRLEQYRKAAEAKGQDR